MTSGRPDQFPQQNQGFEEAARGPALDQATLEPDCEDQATTPWPPADCTNWECQRTLGYRPPLRLEARLGTHWWTCRHCHNSYGEARPGDLADEAGLP